MSKDLEAIVREENRFIKDIIDNFLTRHPVATSLSAFVGSFCLIDYMHEKYSRFFTDVTHSVDFTSVGVASYGLYTILGLFKEYYLEGRKMFEHKKVYDWILQNPKIVAAFSAILSSAVVYAGQESRLLEKFSISSLPPEAKIALINTAVTHGIVGGIFTESIFRGLKNIRRIKKSIKKIKTKSLEKFYNFLFEHPIALSLLLTVSDFYANYYRVTKESRGVYHPKSGMLSGNLLEDIINYPGTMFDFSLVHATRGAAYLGGLLLAGSVLHSYSIKELGLRTKKAYNEFRDRKEKAIDIQEKIIALPNSIERTIEDIVELGNLYYGEDDKDNAYMYFRKALRLISKNSDKMSFADFFRRTTKIDMLRRWRKRRRYSADTEEGAINLMFIDLLNKDRKSLRYIREAAEKDPDNLRLNYLYGRALEVAGYKEEGRKQKQKVIYRIVESGIELKNIPGSKNLVLKIDNGLFKETVISKVASEENIKIEEKITQYFRDLLIDCEDKDVPVPVGIMDINGIKHYVVEYASGDLLADKIRETEETENPDEKNRKINYLFTKMQEIADFMAFIHTNLVPQGEERNSIDTIRTKLIRGNIQKELVEDICVNLIPIVDSLEGIVRVQNKAAHPRNWIIDEFGGIIALDFERERIIPITEDTANLLDMCGRLSNKEKDKVLEVHIDSFREYSHSERLDMKKYHFAYLNSVILKALEVYPMLRRSDQKAMLDSIENSQRAIARIRFMYQEYYKKNSQSYEEIAIAIAKLKEN